MMRSKWSKWLSGVGGALLVGGLVLANYGGGVTPAEAHHRYYQNPFKQILSKLDAILKILNSPNTGGGSTPSPSTGGGVGYQSLSWDTHNQSAALRFTVLADFGNAAVKDNDTGLVWEKLPSQWKRGSVPARDVSRSQSGVRRAGDCRPSQSWRV